MSFVAAEHVTLSGDRAGEYLIEEERPDGRLLLAPEAPRSAITWANIRDPAARDMTAEELDAFMTEHGPHMQSPDGEG